MMPGMLLLLVLLLPLSLAQGEAPRALFKMQHSNPVVSAVVDGVVLRLVLTTEVGGAWVCLDLDASKADAAADIDFDYARKLLRGQLQALKRHPTPREVILPAWNRSQTTNVVYFGLQEQLADASAVEFFLLGTNASGFLGIGLAAHPSDAFVWSLLEGDYYSYAGMASDGNHTAELTVVPASTGDSSAVQSTATRQWSEPAGSSLTTDSANHQDLSFPIHNLHFQCRKTTTNSAESTWTDASSDDEEELEDDDGEDEQAPAASGGGRRTVDVFGGTSGNWDVVVDLNSPCLVLPTEFYSALDGWIGLSYNEQLRVSELPPSSSLTAPPLPVLYFSLAYGNRPVALPLEALVLDQLQLNSTAGDASSSSSSSQNITRRLCVQRSSSIVQNGATIFAVLESDAGTVQRYRMQGSLSLPLYNMVQAPVVLGAMAITAIGGISVNGTNRSCAMSVRSAAELAVDDQAVATCAVELSACIGEQQFVESTNTCEDPDCSRYYFHSLDIETKCCVIDASWLTTLAVTSTVFVAAELFFSTSIRRLVQGAALEATTS